MPESAVRDEERRIAGIFARSGGERPYHVRNELAEIMYDKAGIFRTSERLVECLDKVHELRERVGKVVVEDKGDRFNTDLTSVIELESMLEAADCLVTSGLAREESRGAHTRLDFPERDDDKWMRHTLSWHDAGEVRLDYKPVTVTKYQPQVRSY
jgi:succinate dehydrogenase / fumarate reductase, flavoprotein subunit